MPLNSSDCCANANAFAQEMTELEGITCQKWKVRSNKWFLLVSVFRRAVVATSYPCVVIIVIIMSTNWLAYFHPHSTLLRWRLVSRGCVTASCVHVRNSNMEIQEVFQPVSWRDGLNTGLKSDCSDAAFQGPIWNYYIQTASLFSFLSMFDDPFYSCADAKPRVRKQSRRTHSPIRVHTFKGGKMKTKCFFFPRPREKVVQSFAGQSRQFSRPWILENSESGRIRNYYFFLS